MKLTNSDIHCSKYKTANIVVGCGYHVPDLKDTKTYSSNPKQKLVYELIMDYPNLFAINANTELEIKATNYVKKYGVWWKTKADKIEAVFSICKPTIDCTEYGNPYIYWHIENDSQLNEDVGKWDTDDVTVKPNYVSVDYYVTDLGSTFGPYNLHW